ncbi:MAG TPA: methylamine utilization protein [Gammaproteobacteria bacterium]|jgi:plastocyanin|nr:methylamine utilization protein [Gammaproteobacteria bacterium]
MSAGEPQRMRTHTPRLLACCLAWAAATCSAGTLEVRVVDEHGEPLPHVAVYATPAVAPARSRTEAPRTAVMDQQHNEFVPNFLIVAAGTAVQFPNHDQVSHHVYSFSPAKTFELALYKGNVYPPLVFDRPGLIVLGCNIHDNMLGYILVVPTEHYTVTDERGVARLENVPSGEYTVEAWTPRARPAGLPAAQKLVVADAAKVDMRVTGRLSPEPGSGSKSLSWDRY